MTLKDWLILLGIVAILQTLTYCMSGPDFRFHPETRTMTER